MWPDLLQEKPLAFAASRTVEIQHVNSILKRHGLQYKMILFYQKESYPGAALLIGCLKS